jgi:hypothetical protein
MATELERLKALEKELSGETWFSSIREAGLLAVRMKMREFDADHIRRSPQKVEDDHIPAAGEKREPVGDKFQKVDIFLWQEAIIRGLTAERDTLKKENERLQKDLTGTNKASMSYYNRMFAAESERDTLKAENGRLKAEVEECVGKNDLLVDELSAMRPVVEAARVALSDAAPETVQVMGFDEKFEETGRIVLEIEDSERLKSAIVVCDGAMKKINLAGDFLSDGNPPSKRGDAGSTPAPGKIHCPQCGGPMETITRTGD